MEYTQRNPEKRVSVKEKYCTATLVARALDCQRFNFQAFKAYIGTARNSVSADNDRCMYDDHMSIVDNLRFYDYNNALYFSLISKRLPNSSPASRMKQLCHDHPLHGTSSSRLIGYPLLRDNDYGNVQGIVPVSLNVHQAFPFSSHGVGLLGYFLARQKIIVCYRSKSILSRRCVQ
jgi:hypothetical protein